MKLNNAQRAVLRKELGCPSVMSFRARWRAMSDDEQNAVFAQAFQS